MTMGYEVEEYILDAYAQHLLNKLVDTSKERFRMYKEKRLELHSKLKKPEIQKKKLERKLSN